MISRLIQKYPNSITAISAVMAGGVYSFGFSVITLPIVLALFLLAVTSNTSGNLKSVLIKSSVFFWVFYFIVLVWFLETDAKLLAGLNAQFASLILLFCLVSMVTMWTIVSLPFGLLIHKLRLKIKTPNLMVGILLTSAWLLLEWFRSLAFSIFLYAPGASVGDYWNFGSLGLALINTPLGFLAQYIGMYGLSAIIFITSLTFVWSITLHKYKPVIVLAFIIAIASLVGLTLKDNEANQPKLSASVLQREDNLDDLATSMVDFKYFNESKKDLILLTEYSRIHAEGNEKYANKFVFDRLNAQGISIDVKADFTKPLPRYNILEARNKSGDVISSQTKQLLIPTGEYMPGLVQLFYKFTGQDALNQQYAASRQLNRGESPKVITYGDLTIAPVACSGILGRNIYRTLVNDGGEVLTNSASLVIFKGSQAYFRQSLQMARFHAIANHRTYVQASMGAPAFVIDENGNFIVAPEDTKTAYIDFDFAPQENKTIYTKYGDLPLVLAGLVVGAYVIRLFTKNLSIRRKH